MDSPVTGQSSVCILLHPVSAAWHFLCTFYGQSSTSIVCNSDGLACCRFQF